MSQTHLDVLRSSPIRQTGHINDISPRTRTLNCQPLLSRRLPQRLLRQRQRHLGRCTSRPTDPISQRRLRLVLVAIEKVVLPGAVDIAFGDTWTAVLYMIRTYRRVLQVCVDSGRGYMMEQKGTRQ